MEHKDFSRRLSELRINKGVSARDMSLSIGQSPSYINNIETGMSYPSMTVFFYICDYLGVTPSEFFDTALHDPHKASDLACAARGLTAEQLSHLVALAKDLRRH